MKGAWLLAAALVLAVTGCSGQQSQVQTDQPVAPPPVAQPEPEPTFEEVVEEPTFTPEEPAAPRRATASEIARQLRDIHFDFDKAVVRQVDRQVILANARLLMDNPQVSVVVEGHCDERGTTAYNLALGERRAEATRQALVTAGVSPRQVRTVSYGEEQPLCTRMDESCWQQNRRAHLSAN